MASATAEGNYPDNPSGDTGKVKQRKLGQFRPWIRTDSPTPPPNLPGQTGFYLNMNQKGAQVWQFKSRERGAYNQLSTTHLIRDYTTPTNTSDRLLPLPQRVIFAGEPVTGSIADFNPDPNPAYPTGIWAISDGRNTTMMASAIPQKVLSNENIEPSTDDKRTNHVDAVLEHSLGFGNESDGRLFMQQPSNLSADYAPVTAAVRARREYSFHDSTYTPPGDPITKGEHTTSSTYPWLAWDNRPYVSAEEILKVPAASQSEMLRMYSVVDPNVPAANRNPYDGTGLIDPSQPPSAANLKDTQVPLSRLTVSLSPFGGLLNVFATAALPADVLRDATGAPLLNSNNEVQPYGAPHFSHILEYVQVSSRYVGTDTLLNAETFNDNATQVSTAANPFEDMLPAAAPNLIRGITSNRRSTKCRASATRGG